MRVTANGQRIAVAAPSEEECRRLLGSGVRGTALRFPVFPSSGPSLIARGDQPDELVLWRCGLPAGTWWNLHHYGGKVTLKASTGDIHQPGVGEARRS